MFVSSTFQDMRPERDVLVKRVFPVIRDLCAHRGVTFTEIDLRWGLTDEEVAEGQVLPICLDEIRRCKPYFIGLLGERYGWIPAEIAPELAAEHPWLLRHVGRTSVTELEMRYGVLDDPQMRSRAYFYERDPRYVGSPRFLADTAERPVDRRAYETADPPAEAEALRELKRQLRASRYPIATFTDPDDLASRVLADLTELVDVEFPEGSGDDELTVETRQQDFYAATQASTYVPHGTYLRELDDFADEGGGVFSVVGRSGLGKSALLAAWAARHRVASDGLLLEHYIGTTPKSSELSWMLRRLNHELGRHLGLDDHPSALPGGSDEPETDAAQVFRDRLHAAGQRGRVILVLDALDQLVDDGPGAPLSWLPSTMPAGVSLIVSTRLDGAAHDELGHRGWLDHRLKVEPLNYDGCRRLIDRYLGVGRSKNLSDADASRIAALPQASSPLYLRTFLDELRVWGTHETLRSRIDELATNETIPELLQGLLDRFEQDFETVRPGLLGDALALLWASRQGLSEGELLDLLGAPDQGRLPAAHWSPLRIAMADLLSERRGMLTLSHEFIRSAVRQRYLVDQPAQDARHHQLATYFRVGPITARSIEEAPWQLARARRWTELADLLVDPRWFVALWNRDAVSVRRTWATIEQESGVDAATVYAQYHSSGHPGHDDPAYTLPVCWLLHRLGHVATAEMIATDLLEHLETSDEQARWFHLTATTSADLLADLGQATAALDVLDRADARARAAGRPGDLADILSRRGRLRTRLGDLDAAFEALREAATLQRADDELVALRVTNDNLALAHLERSEFDAALACYEENEAISRALEQALPTVDAVTSQATLEWRRHDFERASILLDAATRLSRESGESDGLRRVAMTRGLLETERGNFDAALEHLARAESIARELGDSDSVRSALHDQAVVHLRCSRPDRALELFEATEAISRRRRDPVALATDLTSQADLHAKAGRIETALARLTEAEALSRSTGDATAQRTVAMALATTHMRAGDLDRARAVLAEAHVASEKVGDRAGAADALAMEAEIAETAGDVDSATLLRRDAVTARRALGDPAHLAEALGRLAALVLAHGDVAEAASIVAEQSRLARGLDRSATTLYALMNTVLLHLRRRELDQALATIDQVESLARELGQPAPLAHAWGQRGLIHLFRRDYEAAAVAFEEEAEILAEMGDPGQLATNLGGHARASAGRGLVDEAVAQWQEQARILRQLDRPFDLAQALAEQARGLDAVGRFDDATACRSEALEIAQARGFSALVHQLTEEQAAARRTQRRPTRPWRRKRNP